MSHAITLLDWIGPHGGHPDLDHDVRAAAMSMLDRVNVLLVVAASDGHQFATNPKTGTLVSGTLYGGFRPGGCVVGAKASKHKTGHAVDVFDPQRRFAEWCARNLGQLEQIGLWTEDWRWTPTWVHLQDIAPGSGRRVYIPSAAPPLVAAVPGQVVA